jgi:C1A family cysteine protease
MDQSWYVYGPPEATLICIRFSVINVETGYDHVYVYDSADNLVHDYTGYWENIWTDWTSGNLLRVRLVADYSVVSWGFAVTGLAVGADVSAESPHPYPDNYDNSWWVDGTPDDDYAFFCTHYPTIQTESGYDWLYDYGTDGSFYDGWSGDFSDQWSSWASGYDMRIRLTSDSLITDYGFLADYSNEWRTAYVESSHRYSDYTDQTWYVYGPSDAAKMRLHFARLNIESYFDHVYVYDAYDNLVADYSLDGDYYDFWTPWGNGNWMRVRFVSDFSVTYWGFRINQYDWQSPGNSITFLTQPTFIGQPAAALPKNIPKCTHCSNSTLPIGKSGEHGLGWRSDMEHIPDSARAKGPVLAQSLPESLDWRNIGGVDWTTPITDQDGCGSCVAFGTIATFEAALKIASGNPSWNPNISEQHIFSCGSGNPDCTYGWNIEPALNYLKDYGAPYEECFPYQAITGHCDWTCSDWQLQTHKLYAWTWVASDVGTIEYYLQSGPAVTAFTVYEDFFDYTGGVYHHTYGDVAGGHCVSIVGYDNVGQYWIVKNSWGPGWGESGYFRIGFGECGINDNVAAITSVPAVATIGFDGNVYSHYQTRQFSSGDHAAVAYAPADYTFTNWETSGGISVIDALSPSTTAQVTGDGTLRAVFEPLATTYTYSLCGKTDPGGRAGISQPYVLGFKVTDVYSSSQVGDYYYSTTGWSSTPASFQVTLAAGESFFVIGAAQVWNDYSTIGSSIAITRDGTRVSGDMFAAGATITSRELATAIAVDSTEGTHIYALSAKTDPGGRAGISQPYVLGFKVTDVYSSSQVGDYYYSTTGWSSTPASFQVTLAAGESFFVIGAAQVWNDYSTIGSSIAITRDGTRVSGDMFAAGATITSRELATAIAVDSTEGTHIYALSAKTDPGGRAGVSQPYLLGFKVSGVYSSSAVGDTYYSTTSWSPTPAGVAAALGPSDSFFLIGAAQVWNDYASVGSSIAICVDGGVRVSGDMFAAGATITRRELATVIAVDTPG